MENEDHRLRDIIVKCSLDEVQLNRDESKIGIAIIGFPYDEGTVINGGRSGGKNASKVFRDHVYKIGCIPNPEINVDVAKYVQIFDLGDARYMNKNIDKSDSNNEFVDLVPIHENLSQFVQKALSHNLIPFVIGGSNDQSYPNAKALIDYCANYNNETKNNPIGVINIDAHFDVRKKKNGSFHSGTPFRQLLENKTFEALNSHFTEFAVQGHQCSQKHFEYIQSKQNTNVVWLSKDLRKNQEKFQLSIPTQFLNVMEKMNNNSKDNICAFFISFDVDSIKASDCPGVSCPSPIGLTAEEALQICLISGMSHKVKLMDCSEFNPVVEDYNTARLIATMFYHFVVGIAMRQRKKSENDANDIDKDKNSPK